MLFPVRRWIHLGLLYTGLKNGSIVELDPVSKKTRIIYSSLSVDDKHLSCGELRVKVRRRRRRLICLSGKDHLEHVCGRPLGIRRFSDDELLVVQAYHGIFKLNVKTSQFLRCS